MPKAGFEKLEALTIAVMADDDRRGRVGDAWDRRDSRPLDGLMRELERLKIRPDLGGDPSGCYCELTKVVERAPDRIQQRGAVIASGRSDPEDPTNVYPYARALTRASFALVEADRVVDLPSLSDRCRSEMIPLGVTLWNQMANAGPNGEPIVAVLVPESQADDPEAEINFAQLALEHCAQVLEASRIAGVIEGLKLGIAAIRDGHDGSGAAYESAALDLAAGLDLELDDDERRSQLQGGQDGEA